MFLEKYNAFFARMSRDMEFRLYYRMIYDCMRLSFHRIFVVPAPKVPKVKLGLQRAILNTLDLEVRLLEKSELETSLRRACVKALTDLSKDWTFQERSKWRKVLPELPAWRRRKGEKRTYSKVRKPGKQQRKRR